MLPEEEWNDNEYQTEPQEDRKETSNPQMNNIGMMQWMPPSPLAMFQPATNEGKIC